MQATSDHGDDTASWQVRLICSQNFNGDNDADQEDSGHFQECLSASGMPCATGCEDTDLSGDGDVDAEDFSLFYPCIVGADSPPGC